MTLLRLVLVSVVLAMALGCATQVQRADTEESGKEQQQKPTAPPTITYRPG